MIYAKKNDSILQIYHEHTFNVNFDTFDKELNSMC